MPGRATLTLLQFPARFTVPEYLGLSFLVLAVSFYWARFINRMV